MRKVVLGVGISLDGYIARLNGDVDFLFMPKDYSMAPFFATIDTAIMGRKTLDAALKMGGGGGFSGSSMTSYVFSRSLAPGKRDGVAVDVARDIREGLANWQLWSMLGWNDIHQRYRRSALGHGTGR